MDGRNIWQKFLKHEKDYFVLDRGLCIEYIKISILSTLENDHGIKNYINKFNKLKTF